MQTRVGIRPVGPFAAVLSTVSCLHKILYFIQGNYVLSSRQCTMNGLAQGFAILAPLIDIFGQIVLLCRWSCALQDF